MVPRASIITAASAAGVIPKDPFPAGLSLEEVFQGWLDFEHIPVVPPASLSNEISNGDVHEVVDGVGVAPTIYWIRQDLRLHDNQALTRAVQRGGPVLPCFIWDDGPGGLLGCKL